MQMQTIYGPVTSRRLGQSLGIDPIPFKTCNWNCVYCQLGRSRPMVNVRREYRPLQTILKEVEETLPDYAAGEIDWLTIVGSGEPTLYSRLGELVLGLKRLSRLPVAVITNGALLYRPEVRAALLAADAVLPSLDAGRAEMYRRINRPWPALTFDRLVHGLLAFRREYRGQLWLEVMLVEGLNDSPEELQRIARLVEWIQPDRVDITLPTRPPAESWVRPASQASVQRAEALFGVRARPAQEKQPHLALAEDKNLAAEIQALITRHPLRETDLLQALKGRDAAAVRAALQELKERGVAQPVERLGERYWAAGQADFADN